VHYVRKAARHDGRSIIPKDTPPRSAVTNARTSCYRACVCRWYSNFHKSALSFRHYGYCI